MATETLSIGCRGVDVEIVALLAQHRIQNYRCVAAPEAQADLLLVAPSKWRSDEAVPSIVIGTTEIEGAVCVPSPVSLARLSALIIQVAEIKTKEEEVVIGSWRLRPQAQLLIKEKKEILLTDKEVQLLVSLQAVYPQAVDKEQLLTEIWGYHPESETHTLETHIYRLRQKIGEALIETSGAGYALRITNPS